jgi:hypothetical protein
MKGKVALILLVVPVPCNLNVPGSSSGASACCSGKKSSDEQRGRNRQQAYKHQARPPRRTE